MPSTRLVGLILIVSALVALGFAYQQSGTFGDATKHFFTGNYRDRTNWLIVGGGIAGVLGLAALMAPGRRSAA